MTDRDTRRAELTAKLAEARNAKLHAHADYNTVQAEADDAFARATNARRRWEAVSAQVDDIQRRLKGLDKPWNEAKRGEGWVLTINGMETMAVVNEDNNFILPDVELFTHTSDMDDISAGRRIFPVEGRS